MNRSNYLLLLLLVTLSFFGCSNDDNSDEPSGGIYLEVTPEDIGDGLVVDLADNVGMNIVRLESLETAIRTKEYTNIHSVLVAKNNKLVYESYYPGSTVFEEYFEWDRNMPHNIHSATKSVTSAIVGIALEQEGLTIDEKIFKHFPEFNIPTDDPRMNVSVGDVLSMSSGIQWDEWSVPYENPNNNHQQMYDSGNWVEFVANQPVTTDPGSLFTYNSGLSILLGAFVTKLTGESVGGFTSKHLFQPMKIFDNQINWFIGPNSAFQTGGGLQMTPRGMMKFGLLFLNEGNWNGNQLISSEWVRNSTSQKGANPGYAYHWWLTSYDTVKGTINGFLAAGRGGQYVIVIDELDLVVVFTGGNDNALASSQPREIMTKFILPSILVQQ